MRASAPAPRPEPPALGGGRPLLLAAATAWEARPLARALGLLPEADGLWRAAGEPSPARLLQTGMGAVRAEESLRTRARAGDYGLVLSVGLCGAMQEGLRAGDLVCDPGEAEASAPAAVREAAARLGLRLHFGRILHTNVVLGPALKRRLGAEHRAAACDMETAAVRRWARAGGTPALGLRAVLDELDEELPDEAPASEAPSELARYALSRPARLPLLVRTGWRSRRGTAALARLLRALLGTRA